MNRVYLFGIPQFEQDGIKIQISRRKSIALLAYLAVSGKPQSRDTLASLFYPEHDASGARNNLRRDLFELKSSTGEAVLFVEREQVGLNSAAALWVDVNAFLAQVERARQHGHTQTGGEQIPVCADCFQGLTEAVALYSADFMAGFNLPASREFEEWQFFQAQTLRKALAEALQLLAQWHRERNESESAIQYARRWLALDPLHEAAHRLLMSLYAQSGQQAAALRQFQECVRRLHDELGVEPDPETNTLYEAIHSRTFTASGQYGPPKKAEVPGKILFSLAPNNLLVPDEPFVGRDSELARITGCLRDEADCRLITLVGPGGMGKTRLAIEAALRLAEDAACPFCEGIYFVPLAALSQADSLVLAIAEALKLPLLPDPEQRTQQLLGYLQPKRLLLLLDNFEHLVNDQSVKFMVDLLAQAPLVKMLVTSQRRLNAHFEHVLTLGGLDIPQSQADYQDQPIESVITGYSAIRFFVQRARHLKPDFSIAAGNLESVMQICRMVEGMPLGLELAATWLDVLTPDEIATEISRSLDFLAAAWPDRPERQHSLRAVFDSSWKLLAEPERAALMSLTVFQSGFSRQAAQAVSGAPLQLLMALQNKSWLQVQNGNRYQIHELLCQYANEYLQADPSAWQLARDRFSSYFASLLDQLAEQIRGSKQREAYEAIAREFENIRLAWQWLVASGQVDLAVQQMLPALFRYAEVRAKPFELTQLLDLALNAMAQNTAASTHPHNHAILRIARAAFNSYGYPMRINYIYSNRDQEEAVRQTWRLAGDVESLKAMDIWGILLAFLYGLLEDPQEAANRLRDLIAYYREQQRRWELAYALYLLGGVLELCWKNVTDVKTNQAEAGKVLMEALMLFQELGDTSQSGYTQNYIGELYLSQGKYQEAIEQFEAAQAALQLVGEWVFAATNLAEVYMRMGDYTSASNNYLSTSQAFAALGHKIGAAIALSMESLNALRHGDLEHARQTRKHSMVLYQESGNALGTAWTTWEMGEIERVGGNLVGAKVWFEKARHLFEQLDDRSSPIFIHRGMGDLAQMMGDYGAAKHHFQESIQQAQQTNHQWALTYALCGLGRAEVASGEPEMAQARFSQAMQTAQDMGEAGLALIAAAGFASLFAMTGKTEQAVELGSMVFYHKFSWNETKSQMSALLDSLHSIHPDRFGAAQERGRNLDIEEAIKRFDFILNR